MRKVTAWWVGWACYKVCTSWGSRGWWHRCGREWVPRLGMTWFYARAWEDWARSQEEADAQEAEASPA